ncbi:glycosyltransferase family 2 protein [Aliiroseovarius halocynthiae]|uniref:Glycosyltransferase family 2 protein n=1 Tax=Aliiroseovarius halocynthiae TaxID=985055 RepID=A0A545SRE1_9RHOB|nr:glycosyltransferase family 2 protein [Aliiroseovarius halocynthiae]
MTLDGADESHPRDTDVNFTAIPHRPMPRVPGEKRRAAYLSAQARTLFMQGYDAVIATDIDEFIVVDPRANVSLAEYLSAVDGVESLSALGLDVIQHLDNEGEIDPKSNWLAQRKYAQLASRYTKPSITFKPLNWGSGMHRIKGRNFRIDPNLFMIHTGMIDAKIAKVIGMGDDRVSQGWSAHQERREKVFQQIRKEPAEDGNAAFTRARRKMSVLRPIHAWNKPGSIRKNSIVKLPDEFADIL